MLLEPARSPYDFEFNAFGFPVRVAWGFWCFSAIIGFGWARSLDNDSVRLGNYSPGVYPLLIIWVLVSAISTLVHELGHSFAMRAFGVRSYIVLYHMGGLAIPMGVSSAFEKLRLGRWQQIIISAAGPIVQVALGILIAVLVTCLGFSTGSTHGLLSMIGIRIPGELISNAAVRGAIDATIFYSIAWGLLNLLPILPMDGGNIAWHSIGLVKRSSGYIEACYVSVLVAAIVGAWAFRSEQPMLTLMMIAFAMINLQNLQNPYE